MTTCSQDWSDPTLPAWGTAARAGFWVGLEQPGPWGSKAATQSRLDPEIGAAIEQWCLDKGGRLVLLRTPGGEDDPNKLVRRVFIAGNLSGTPWLGATELTGPASLTGLLDSLNITRADTRPTTLDRHPALLTICTNARRDQCCALSGLPLARSLADEHPGQVWESSHLGGHRFAATALLWPTGQVLGRLTPPLADDGLRLAERDLVFGAGPAHDRGRSHLPPERQAAEAFVRSLLPPRAPADVTSRETDRPGEIIVSVRGDEHLVRVHKDVAPGLRKESCGKDAIATLVWRVAPLDLR